MAIPWRAWLGYGDGVDGWELLTNVVQAEFMLAEFSILLFFVYLSVPIASYLIVSGASRPFANGKDGDGAKGKKTDVRGVREAPRHDVAGTQAPQGDIQQCEQEHRQAGAGEPDGVGLRTLCQGGHSQRRVYGTKQGE